MDFIVFRDPCCAGVPGLITADMVKAGAAVIDVGINRILDPKTGKVRLIGDVDFEGELLLVLPPSLFFFHQERIVQLHLQNIFVIGKVFVVIWLTTC